MRYRSILSVAAVLVVSAAGRTAWGADDTTKQCVADAAAQYKIDRTAAQDVFKTAKDVCRNRDPVCAEACRTAHEGCVDVPEAAVESCMDICATTLSTARDDCKESQAEDTPERKTCIDDAQVDAFKCRDACRDNADRAALQECKTGFKACIQACAASAPPN